MKIYHDYHLFGYRVDGEKKELQFDVAWLYPEDPNPRPRETVTFRKVEGYFLEHDLGVNILYAIEEVDIVEHINSNARFFEEQSKWGWPAFWKASAERTIEY